LKHLAHYRADEELRAVASTGQEARTYAYYFVQFALSYAREFGVALDDVTLSEFDKMSRDIGV